MAFEATRSLAGARQIAKIAHMELEAVNGYSSPSFSNTGGGRSNMPSDRVSSLVFRKDDLTKKLDRIIDACLHMEEASLAELDTVENLELRAMIVYRELYGMTWAKIGKEMNMTADAAKKRYERGMKSYLDEGIVVVYPKEVIDALVLLRIEMRNEGIPEDGTAA